MMHTRRAVVKLAVSRHLEVGGGGKRRPTGGKR